MLDKSNLARRLMFAIPAIPIGWWLINSPLSLMPAGIPVMYPGHLLAIALTIAACFEYTKMLSVSFPRNGFWLIHIWLIFFLLLDQFAIAPPLRYAIFLLLFTVACEAIIWGDKNSGRWKRASLLFIATVFLYIAGVSMMNLYQDSFQTLFKSYKSMSPMLSQLGIISLIGSIFFCDTAAYFVGSLFGKHHFSAISPNKTVEGVVGGFVVAVITFSVCWYFLGSPVYPRYLGIIMGLFIGVFAQVGDLFVSLMKRYFKVKNASDIIPGHGGILDRFGSVFFTVPTLGLIVWIVNRFIG